MVKWLHENRREGCTTEAIDLAASHGHLEVVKWLHNNRKEGCTAEAMNKAVAHGHLEVVEWLRNNPTVFSTPQNHVKKVMLKLAHGYLFTSLICLVKIRYMFFLMI